MIISNYIRVHVLQAWKLEQEQQKEEEMAKKSKKENTQKGRQQQEEARSKDNKRSKTLASGKKSRAEAAGSSAKTPKESITNTAPPLVEKEEVHSIEEPCGVRTHSLKMFMSAAENKQQNINNRLCFLSAYT